MMTFEEFISAAKELRAAVSKAEDGLMEFLLSVEQQPKIWAGHGDTFLRVIEANDLCRPVKYDRWKRVRLGLGKEEIAGVGVHGVVAAGKFNEPEKQREVLAEVRQVEIANETKVSEQTANEIAKNVKQRHGFRENGHKTYPTLLSEVDRLRLQLAQRETEISALRAENAALKKQLSQLGKKSAA